MRRYECLADDIAITSPFTAPPTWVPLMMSDALANHSSAPRVARAPSSTHRGPLGCESSVPSVVIFILHVYCLPLICLLHGLRRGPPPQHARLNHRGTFCREVKPMLPPRSPYLFFGGFPITRIFVCISQGIGPGETRGVRMGWVCQFFRHLLVVTSARLRRYLPATSLESSTGLLAAWIMRPYLNRLPDGKLSLMSDIRDEKGIDVEAQRLRGSALGGITEWFACFLVR